MTSPAQARTDDDELRWYTHPIGGQTYPSVTTVLKVVAKQALVPWAAKVTAEYAVENVKTWVSLEPQAAVDLIKKEGRRPAQVAADIGTAVHAAAELYAIHGEPPNVDLVIDTLPEDVKRSVDADTIRPFIEQYGDFLDTWRPRFLHTEATIYNHTFGYAGSLDALAELPGLGVLVIDTKTGKGVYSEAALQQAAYSHGEEIVTGPPWATEPMPEVAGAAVLHLRPESWKLVELDSSEDTFHAFVCATGLAEWQRDSAKGAVGPPFDPPAEEVADHDPELLRRVVIATRHAGMDTEERHAFVREVVGKAGLTDCDDGELRRVEAALNALKLPLATDR